MNEEVLNSPVETEQKGIEIARKLKPGDVVAFTGGLGSGKTFIIKAICRELGVREAVTSPTFTLMHLYEGSVPVLHLDCYRLQSADEAGFLGIDEYFNSEYICLVEWAERIKPVLPDNTIFITMSRIPLKESSRSITIDGL